VDFHPLAEKHRLNLITLMRAKGVPPLFSSRFIITLELVALVFLLTGNTHPSKESASEALPEWGEGWNVRRR